MLDVGRLIYTLISDKEFVKKEELRECMLKNNLEKKIKKTDSLLRENKSSEEELGLSGFGDKTIIYKDNGVE